MKYLLKTNMVYGNGLFVSLQNTDSVIRNLLVRYLYDAHLNVCYLNKYIVQMRMGGLSTDSNKRKQMLKEDIMLYRKHNLHPAHVIKLLKMSWKVPQFISAMLHKNRPLNRVQDDKCFSKEIYDNAKIR